MSQRYVPIGQEFDDDEWWVTETDFERRILAACKRKYHSDKVTMRRIKSIEKGMNQQPPKYPPAYVDSKIAFAIQKNSKAVNHKIPFKIKALVALIRNPDNLSRWYEEQGNGATDLDEYSQDC